MNFNERAAGLTNKTTVLMVLLVGLVVAAFDYYGQSGRGLAAASSLTVMFTAIQFFWDLKRQLWFWIAMVSISAIHVALIIAIPWGNGPFRFPAPFLFLAVALDFGAVYLFIKLGENVSAKKANRK